MARTNRQNIFEPSGQTKYLLHKTYKFGYIQDVKVIFKFDLTTV